MSGYYLICALHCGSERKYLSHINPNNIPSIPQKIPIVTAVSTLKVCIKSIDMLILSGFGGNAIYAAVMIRA